MKDHGSLRLFIVKSEQDQEQRIYSGYLMRRSQSFFDKPSPSAWGNSIEEVRDGIAVILNERLAEGDTLGRYLWTESFATRSIRAQVLPAAIVKSQAVVGTHKIPLRLSFAWCKTEHGAFRVHLPRFDWFMMMESLDDAVELVGAALTSSLMGANPKWIFDFRYRGEESVQEWRPDWLRRETEHLANDQSDDDFPEMNLVADDWVEMASKNRLPKSIGEQLPNMARYLPNSLFHSPTSFLVVGDSGVGKTSFVMELAHALRDHSRKNKRRYRLFATSAERITAGMMYVGMWQERCYDIIKELRHEDAALYVDHLAELVRPMGDGGSIAEILYPAIANDSISVIAECTKEEHAKLKRTHASLLGAFTTIHVQPPAAFQLQEMVGVAARRAGLDFHPSACERLVHLLATYRCESQFPGKAFQLVDWVKNQNVQSDNKTWFPPDITEAFSKHSGLPLELISEEHTTSVQKIASALGSRVIGQDDACTRCAKMLVPFKAGLNPTDKPVATLLFAGPTGVGKTELAKQMARYMFGDAQRMIRLDMSEFMMPGSARRLLAVGRDENSLASLLRKQPLSVVLLDEIEKADSEIFDLLLGVFGEGRLTDLNGRLVDCRMSVFIMTSNLGVTTTAPIGYSEDASGGDFVGAVRDHFRPEFVGRLDDVIGFRSLSAADIHGIVDLLMLEANARPGLVRRNVTLTLTEAARTRLAALGFNAMFGARPLKRTIEERVITPFSVTLAADPKLNGCQVRVISEEEAAKEGNVHKDPRVVVV